MNVLSFVNSKAIREHLSSISYEFNSVEAAWLIYNCHNLSYEQKKEAWLELISIMPDCEIPTRMNCVERKSLHEFLRQYINVIDRELEKFSQESENGKYVYMYSYLYRDDNSWTEEYETVFPSLKLCIEAYRNDLEFIEDSYNSESTGVLKYCIKRQSLYDVNDVFEVEFLPNGQVVDILQNTARDECDSKIIMESFEGMWFNFPTPFEKGDIVWIPKDAANIDWDCEGGFVLKGLSTWKSNEFIRKNGDNTDMNAFGYFVNPDGTVYYEVMYNYMDLEYYKGPYKANERILPALSKFIKGDIEVDLLMCIYRKVILDVASDDIMLKSWYPRELLYESGIE